MHEFSNKIIFHFLGFWGFGVNIPVHSLEITHIYPCFINLQFILSKSVMSSQVSSITPKPQKSEK